MSNWQERITHDTAPAIRVEHELRYRIAAPLILSSDVWADLGCGNGLGAAAALDAISVPGRAATSGGSAAAVAARESPAVVLIDVDEQAVARAQAELDWLDTTALCGDLADEAVLAQIEEALFARKAVRPVQQSLVDAREGIADQAEVGRTAPQVVVTCFEVVEHITTFVPLLEWSGRLARERGVTFILSVPNDAFHSVENPHHRTVWGEGAFEQLQSLLPKQRTELRQVALTGSAVVGWELAPLAAVATPPLHDEQGEREHREREHEHREGERVEMADGGEAHPQAYEIVASVGGPATVATHFLVAFGPAHAAVGRGAAVVQLDALAQRRWERERESNLAIAEETVRVQSETIAEQDAQLKRHIAEFEQWRAYIHELEGKMGLPLSGQGGRASEAEANSGELQHRPAGGVEAADAQAQASEKQAQQTDERSPQAQRERDESAKGVEGASAGGGETS